MNLKSILSFIFDLFNQCIGFLESVTFQYPPYLNINLAQILFGGFIIVAVVSIFYKGAKY